MKLFLIRHPESESNKCLTNSIGKIDVQSQRKLMLAYGNPNITNKGIEQVDECKKLQLDGSVWTSPMARTQLLAQALLQTNDHVITKDMLMEFNTQGKKNDWPKDKTFAQFVRRVYMFYIKEILPVTGGKNIIIVGHSLFFSVLLSTITLLNMIPDIKIDKLINILNKLKTDVTFHLPNCSISTLTWEHDHFRITGVAVVDHIPCILQTGLH